MEQETTRPAAADAQDARRQELALAEVKRAAAWSAFGGMIPLPVIDVVAVGGVQLNMLRRLAQIYDVPFTQDVGKSVVASLAGSIFPASTATTTAMGAASALKAVPAVGAAVSILAMPALSAGATYVIGKVFMKHFASGGTLLDFNAPDYREFIAAHAPNLGGRSSRAAQERQAPAP
jgi:uncharacterized protein (DUF697 family)